jgi:hypothetical protein
MRLFFIFLLTINDLSNSASAQKRAPQADVVQTVNAAAGLLNRFWGNTFRRADLNYVPPTQVTPYTRPRQTACGVTLANNAFYCPADRSIWYDQAFLADIQQRKGRFAVYTVIAHEWGHFVSYELRENHRRSIGWELQADCLAGIFIRWLSDQLPSDSAEYIQGAQTLLSMGDRSTTLWFAPGAHGQPAQRVRAFFHGFYQGHTACFDN